jgi:hypothetical protein
MRPYNLLRPEIQWLMGKKLERPMEYTVMAMNSDSENLKEKEKLKMMQSLMQKLNSAPEGMEQEVKKEVEKHFYEFVNSYRDVRAIEKQKGLDYVVQEQRLKEVIMELWKDWNIAGEAYSYVEVRNEDVKVRRISPYQIDFHETDQSKYVEDSDWVVCVYEMSPNEILDMFYEDLTEEEVKRLDDHAGQHAFYSVFNSYYSRNSKSAMEQLQARNIIEVIHTQFKAFKPIYILTYIDEFGQEMEDVVDESFKLSKEMKDMGWLLNKRWVSEAWELWLIDGEIYKRIRPIPQQRNMVNNYSTCKLSYNGKKFSNTHADNVSIMELGMPLQIMYVILWFRLENLIAKSRGAMAVIDINSIPNGEGKIGFTPSDFLFYSDALGLMVLDLAQEGVNPGTSINNAVSKVDTGMLEMAQQYLQLMEACKMQWEQLTGITRQAKGQTMASEGLGVTQSSVYQATSITEYIFEEFERFEERLFTQITDMTTFAWLNGKKAVLLRDNGSLEYLNIDPVQYVNTEAQVFVRSNAEFRKIDQLRQAAIQTAGNKGDLETIAKVIKATNFAKLEGILAEMKDKEQKYIMEQQQQQQEGAANVEQVKAEAAQKLQQLQQDYEMFKHQLEIEKINVEYDRKERIELIKGQMEQNAFAGSSDLNGDGQLDALELAGKMQIEGFKEEGKRMIEAEKSRIQEKKIDADIQMQREEAVMKKQESDAKMKIEQLKAKTALKNKTSGEKK